MGLKLEVGKTFIDESGNKVQIICRDVVAPWAPYLGLMDIGGHDCVRNYAEDGTSCSNYNLVREHDQPDN